MDNWGFNNFYNKNQQNKGSFDKVRSNSSDLNNPINSNNVTGNSGWRSNSQNSALNSGNILNRAVFSKPKSNQDRSSQFNIDDRSNARKYKTKDKVVSITYEEIGLFPRSFSRVFDRFLKQIFSDVENLVIQEYRFYRYLFLTTIQTIFILVFVPLVVNFIAKTYLIRPITEYFWNTKQTEIFLNSYEQKRAFVELQDFEEKLYFESLLISNNFITATSQSDVDISVANLTSSVNLTNSKGYIKNSKTDTLESNSNVNTIQEPQLKYQNNDELNKIQLGGFTNPMLGMPWFGLISTSSNAINHTFLANSEKNSTQNMSTSNLKTDPPSSISNSMLLTSSLASQVNYDNKSSMDTQNLVKYTSAVPSSVEATKYYLNQSSLFLALSESLQEKTLELAIRYNNHSIEAITNFFADFLSLITLLYLLISLEIQINITKSFLLEVFFGLDDSKKSLLILIMTDLLVGYHSSNLWELFFQFIFNHYGIPESQTGIFLLVATLPVLLDVLFKYLIFRHLNRSSPATVATYHAIIE